ncbi:MAG TPA: CARDB domain-containing protein, partial [Candidatus Thermoplasmatota archaeon]|nr:CARDB domain-containing protein [Candidatus Thermoplasmatota archaeon]
RLAGVAALDVRPLRAAAIEVAATAPRLVAGALAYPVVVQNAGNVATPFEMVLLGLPQGVQAKLSPSVFALEPGARTVATLLVTPAPTVAAGDVSIGGYARFPGVVADSAEGRANLRSITVEVARPELRVGALDVAPRAGIEEGERVVVRVPVTNGGAAAVADVPVHLYVDDVFMAEARLAQLSAGETREVVLNWTAQPGQRTLTVVVDPYRDAVETDRADDAASALATVDGSPLSGIGAASSVPGPSALLVVLVAVLAALVAGRSRRRQAK